MLSHIVCFETGPGNKYEGPRGPTYCEVVILGERKLYVTVSNVRFDVFSWPRGGEYLRTKIVEQF
jgi:hypothetical protein